ncbi:MobA/MobL family protein, partial [Faecalibacterium prausnitzii]
RAERVVLHDVELPEAAPAEYRDPEALWNAAEAAQRGNECYAHRENMALPRELAEKDGEFEKLVRDYVERVVKATGHAV